MTIDSQSINIEFSTELPFSECYGIRNHETGKPVKRCRDGEQLPPDVGEQLVSKIDSWDPSMRKRKKDEYSYHDNKRRKHDCMYSSAFD